MASMNDPRLKQLKIKTGVLKRISNEHNMYGKEIGKEEERLVKMTAGGGEEEEARLKYQAKVIEESRMMLQETTQRLSVAHGDLKSVLKEVEDWFQPLRSAAGDQPNEDIDAIAADIEAARSLLESNPCDAPMDV